MGETMKLPPEFNSWNEVWDEHQLRGREIRALVKRAETAEARVKALEDERAKWERDKQHLLGTVQSQASFSV